MVRSDTRPMLLAASLNPADLRRDFGQAPGLAGSGSGFRKSLPHSSHKGHGAGLMAPPWHNTLCLLGMEGLGAQTDGGTVEDVQFWQEILPWPWCCGARQGNALSQGATCSEHWTWDSGEYGEHLGSLVHQAPCSLPRLS